MSLNEQQIHRYSRQIVLKGFGAAVQEKLLGSSVLVIGCGGLGSPASLYLAAAGVGVLGLADPDTVDVSNLQRQILHSTQVLGKQKSASAAETLQRLNPDVRAIPIPERATAANLAELIKDYDFVIDATDGFDAKFAINDACVAAGKPFSHAGLLAWEGQTMTVLPGHACYRCLFPAPPPPGAVPTCASAGILGPVAGVIGSVQAAETIKVLTGLGEPLLDRLFVLDSLTMTSRIVPIHQAPACPACGNHRPV